MWGWVIGCSVPGDEVEHSVAAPPAPPVVPPAPVPAPECGEPTFSVVVEGEELTASADGAQGDPWYLGVAPGRGGIILRDEAGDELLALSGWGSAMVVAVGGDGRPRWTRVVSGGWLSEVAAAEDGVVALGEWVGPAFVEGGRAPPVTRNTQAPESFVARWDARGDLSWVWTAPGRLRVGRVAAGDDGSVRVAGVPEPGITVEGVGTVQGAFVLELDPAGGVSWLDEWGSPGSGDEVAALAVDPVTGDAVLAGRHAGGDLFGSDGLDRDGRFVAWWRDGAVVRTLATGPSMVTSLATGEGAVAVGGWTLGGDLLGLGGPVRPGSFVGELGADGAPRWAWAFDGNAPTVAADAGGLEFVADDVSRLALDTPTETPVTAAGATVGRVGSTGALRCAGPPLGEPGSASWLVRGAPLVVATWQAGGLWVRGW